MVGMTVMAPASQGPPTIVGQSKFATPSYTLRVREEDAVVAAARVQETEVAPQVPDAVVQVEVPPTERVKVREQSNAPSADIVVVPSASTVDTLRVPVTYDSTSMTHPVEPAGTAHTTLTLSTETESATPEAGVMSAAGTQVCVNPSDPPSVQVTDPIWTSTVLDSASKPNPMRERVSAPAPAAIRSTELNPTVGVDVVVMSVRMGTKSKDAENASPEEKGPKVSVLVPSVTAVTVTPLNEVVTESGWTTREFALTVVTVQGVDDERVTV